MYTVTDPRVKRIALLAVLLATCGFYLTFQPFPAFATSFNPPGTVTTWGIGASGEVPVNFISGLVPQSISATESEGGMAITQDGALYEWYGVASAVPTRVTFPAGVTQVTSASKRSSHALAGTNDGLYAWGQNDKGQLGDGTTTNRYSSPAKVIFPGSVTRVTAIAAGYVHSLAVTNDGLYAWGDNWNGELGDGTRINRSLPIKVALPATVTSVVKVAAGRNTSYALTNDGLYAWGNDFAGQLGNGSYGILPDGSSDVGQTLPVKVIFNTKGKVVVTSVSDIAAGEYYGLAITNDGLYAWGMNVAGTLGIGSTVQQTATPTKVKFPKAVTVVKVIAASTNHSLAITNDGLYGWGNNSNGQLGVIGISYTTSPIKVPGEDNAIGIGAAEYSSIALH